jgi:predicted lysophospholipase L1 biosynthesis ABC-type transport system permease subunit
VFEGARVFDCRVDRWLVAKSTWRDTWRATLTLALLVVATVAAVSATLTAATRSQDAFDRLRRATLASDVTVNSDEDGPPPTKGQLRDLISDVAKVDGVEAVGAQAELFVTPRADYYPDYNLYAYAPLQIDGAQPMDVPVITEGRDVDATRADEVVLSERLAADLGVRSGDSIDLSSMTSSWADRASAGVDAGPPDGPGITATVVGIARSPADFGRWQGVMRLSPAYFEAFGDEVHAFESVHVRLEHRAALESSGFELGDSWFADFGATTDGLGTAATALRLVALTIGLAGAFAMAIASIRLCRLTMRDHETLWGLGWSSRRMAETSLAVITPVLVASIAIGVSAGAWLAPAVQVGLARSIDPVGRAPVVLWPAALGCAAATFAFVAVITAVAVGPHASGRQRHAARATVSPIPLGRPLGAVLGSRLALFTNASRGGRVGRGALVAGIAGITCAVAALTISASITRLQTDPELSGQGGDRSIDSGDSTSVFDQAMPILEGDARVERLAGIHIGFVVAQDEPDQRTVLAFDVRRGTPTVAIVDGRLATGADEVMLGPATLDDLDVEVGDRITLAGPQGSARFRIVGSTLFPEGDFKHDEGIAMTVDAVRPLVGDPHATFPIHQITFQWAPSTDDRGADAELAARGFTVMNPDDALMPGSVTNLGQVVALPRYVAILVGLLALVSLANAIEITTRQRRRDWATLKALGITGRSTVAIALWYCATIAAVSLAVGVPLGLITGHQVWLPIAERAHVVVRWVWGWSTIGALCAVTLACAVLMGSAAGWRVESTGPAQALRSE